MVYCVADPLQLHWVKYGGAVYRMGLIPPTLIRSGLHRLPHLVAPATL